MNFSLILPGGCHLRWQPRYCHCFSIIEYPLMIDIRFLKRLSVVSFKYERYARLGKEDYATAAVFTTVPIAMYRILNINGNIQKGPL